MFYNVALWNPRKELKTKLHELETRTKINLLYFTQLSFCTRNLTMYHTVFSRIRNDFYLKKYPISRKFSFKLDTMHFFVTYSLRITLQYDLYQDPVLTARVDQSITIIVAELACGWLHTEVSFTTALIKQTGIRK